VRSDVFALLVVNGGYLAAGAGVSRAAGWWGDRRSFIHSIGLAYLVGAAAYGVIAQLLFVLGASLTTWQVALVCVALASLGFVRGGACVRPAFAPTWLALPTAAMLVLLAVDLWLQPMWSYDAWTFWVPKGWALVQLDGLAAGWFTAADLPNPDYPILLPALEAALFRVAGYATGALDLQSWLLLGGFVLATAELAADRSRALVVWTMLTLVVFAPGTVEELAFSEADIPLAAFFGAAGLCAFVWLEERDRAPLVLAGVLSAGVVATKVEGTIFVAALFAVLAVLARPRRADTLLAVVVGAAAFATGLLPWRIWMRLHDVESQASLGRIADAGFLGDHAARLPKATTYVVGELLDPRRWLLIAPLALVAIVVAYRSPRRRGAVLALAVAALGAVGLIVAYWTTPLDFDTHLATSARRVVTGIVFFWAALTPVLIGRAEVGGDDDYPLRP